MELRKTGEGEGARNMVEKPRDTRNISCATRPGLPIPGSISTVIGDITEKIIYDVGKTAEKWSNERNKSKTRRKIFRTRLPFRQF